MNSHFLQMLNNADSKNWCVRPWCTTCGARNFRSAIESIDNLQIALETVDLDVLTSHRNWCDALRTTAMDHGSQLDWGQILLAWLPYAENNIDFADHMLYYLVNQVPCNHEVRNKWLETSIKLAVKSKDLSLLESLVRTLGSKTSTYSDLSTTALELSSYSKHLMSALVKAGLVSSKENLCTQKKFEIAGHHLFGAIRRNDVKAIHALIARRCDFSVKNNAEMTALEYAKSIERFDLVKILESAIAHESPISDNPRNSTSEPNI